MIWLIKMFQVAAEVNAWKKEVNITFLGLLLQGKGSSGVEHRLEVGLWIIGGCSWWLNSHGEAAATYERYRFILLAYRQDMGESPQECGCALRCLGTKAHIVLASKEKHV